MIDKFLTSFSASFLASSWRGFDEFGPVLEIFGQFLASFGESWQVLASFGEFLASFGEFF